MARQNDRRGTAAAPRADTPTTGRHAITRPRRIRGRVGRDPRSGQGAGVAPCGSQLGYVGGESEVLQDSLDHRRLFDQRHEAQPPAAARTGQDIAPQVGCAIRPAVPQRQPDLAVYGVVVGLEDWISAEDNIRILDAIGSDYIAVY